MIIIFLRVFLESWWSCRNRACNLVFPKWKDAMGGMGGMDALTTVKCGARDGGGGGGGGGGTFKCWRTKKGPGEGLIRCGRNR